MPEDEASLSKKFGKILLLLRFRIKIRQSVCQQFKLTKLVDVGHGTSGSILMFLITKMEM